VAICDKKTAGVLEITPKTVILRRSVEGICACTNHFRTPELATDTTCGRYSILKRSRKNKQFDVAGVAKQMDAVNQGNWTLQTMIFEPSPLKLHLAYGIGPATKLPLHTLDLSVLFGKDREKPFR
jgi:hypothetical protein